MVPPFLGVTPPTICVPYWMACMGWVGGVRGVCVRAVRAGTPKRTRPTRPPANTPHPQARLL